jgi:hypothetical protein
LDEKLNAEKKKLFHGNKLINCSWMKKFNAMKHTNGNKSIAVV